MNSSARFGHLLTTCKAFLTSPVSSKPLAIFRILMAAFALVQAFLWYPDWHAFFGEAGWIQWEISEALNEDWRIHMHDVHLVFQHLGFSANQTVEMWFWIYVVCTFGLLLGWYTRIWAFLAWACHYVMMASMTTFVYGVDIFLHISLFYMILMPVNKAFSLDLKQGRASPITTWADALSLRVLQFHLCLVYLSSGFEKMLIKEWWDGNVLWRSLVQPDFRQFDLIFLVDMPWLVMLLSWFTMIVETFYFAAMWTPKVRLFWLGGIAALHLGIGMFLGLWMFGIIMILLSVSAFGVDAWQDLRKFRQSWSL